MSALSKQDTALRKQGYQKRSYTHIDELRLVMLYNFRVALWNSLERQPRSEDNDQRWSKGQRYLHDFLGVRWVHHLDRPCYTLEPPADVDFKQYYRLPYCREGHFLDTKVSPWVARINLRKPFKIYHEGWSFRKNYIQESNILAVDIFTHQGETHQEGQQCEQAFRDWLKTFLDASGATSRFWCDEMAVLPLWQEVCEDMESGSEPFPAIAQI